MSTDLTTQTLPGFFHRPAVGDPLCTARLSDTINKLANILETITGTDGIVIHKTRAHGGVGWTISGRELSGTPVTVITGIQFDATSHYIQIKTREITVGSAGTESDWTNTIEVAPFND